MQPITLGLFADRHTPWTETSFEFTGVDLTGAVLASHIRLHPDATGSPLKSFGMAADATADGFYLTSVVYTGGQPVSTVTLRAASMTALPAATEVGLDAQFAWDMHVTLPFDVKQVWMRGPLTLRAGATQ